MALRVFYAASRPVPVSADTAYYLMVARNLHAGHGFVSGYVWNYLAGVPGSLPVPSNEYWMPGTSVVAAATFAVAGDSSVQVAQWPSLVFGALLCAITAWIAGAISGRQTAALLAGVAAAVNYYLIELSLNPDHFMLNAVLVNLSLLALWAGWRGKAWMAGLSGGLSGFSYLTRSDGALLVGVALLLAAATHRRARRHHGLWLALWFVGAFAAVATPWWIRQALVFGHASGAGPLRTAFLTSYNDIFQLDQSKLNLASYLATSQAAALGTKAYVLYITLRVLAKAVLAVGLLGLGVLAIRDLRRESAPWLVYLLLGILVPSLLVPYPTAKGGSWHLLPALVPGIIAVGAAVALRLVERARGHPGTVLIGVATAIVGFGSLLYWWVRPPADSSLKDKPLYPAVAAQAVGDLGSRRAPALTDNAWGLYHVAGLPCAQFPSDGVAAALKVADSVSARYLITRADAPKAIPAMSQVIGHPRFRPLARYPAGDTTLLVYRIIPPAPARR